MSTRPFQRGFLAVGDPTLRGISSGLRARRVETQRFIVPKKRSVAAVLSSRPRPTATPSRLPARPNKASDGSTTCDQITFWLGDMGPLCGIRPVFVGKCGRRAGEPGLAMAVEALYHGAFQLRQVALDGVAELRLQVAQVPVSLREAAEQIGIELEAHRRIQRIHAILFVD